MVTETSMEAHSQLKASRVRECYKIILRAISASGPMNNTMISVQTNLKINVVCPRVLELRRMGHLESAGRGICPINKTSTEFWRIKR